MIVKNRTIEQLSEDIGISSADIQEFVIEDESAYRILSTEFKCEFSFAGEITWENLDGNLTSYIIGRKSSSSKYWCVSFALYKCKRCCEIVRIVRDGLCEDCS